MRKTTTRTRQPSRRAKPAPHRAILPRWGDQHPHHRIPTFLEILFFEGDDSATVSGRYRN